jgi:hypothetical protein
VEAVVEARVCALDGTGSQLVAGGADHHLDRLPPCGRLPIAGIPKPQKQLRKAGWAADRRCQAGTELGDLDWLVQVGRRDALGAGAKEEIAERLAGGEPLARRVTVCRLSASLNLKGFARPIVAYEVVRAPAGLEWASKLVLPAAAFKRVREFVPGSIP